MSDLIERDKAIEAVLGLHTEHRVYWKDAVVDALKALPSAQPEERTEERTETHACDCISRQAAIDALMEQFKRNTPIAIRAKITVEALPSAQPEIIRCKDCKHYEADIMANPWGVCCHDGWVDGHSGHEVSENGWCYRAERRSDG